MPCHVTFALTHAHATTTKVNMEYSTKEFCIYYAIESFHNDLEYGSQASN